MRAIYLVITLEYIINTVDIKEIDLPGYWPIKDSICLNTHHPLFRQFLRFISFEGQPLLN